jgi:hypothetical protein
MSVGFVYALYIRAFCNKCEKDPILLCVTSQKIALFSHSISNGINPEKQKRRNVNESEIISE